MDIVIVNNRSGIIKFILTDTTVSGDNIVSGDGGRYAITDSIGLSVYETKKSDGLTVGDVLPTEFSGASVDIKSKKSKITQKIIQAQNLEEIKDILLDIISYN